MHVHAFGQRLRRLAFNHIHHLLSAMGLCVSATSRVRFTGRIGQRATCGKSQLQRYASPVMLIGL